MDVDCELDGDLLTKFNCLGTTDHDVLISQLQRLLDFQLNPTGCAFFLDMTNWNLQKMEIEMELKQRIEEEGFEIAFNPPGDGNCFYRAATFQLGFKSEILHNLIFDYLESHQFDAAVGAYYDFNGSQDKLPTMSFIRDVTIGEGESVQPNTSFVKTWRIQNNGNTAWPSGVFLKYTAGDQLGPVNLVSVKPLDAGEYHDLSVNMISPGKPGMYQGQWRMCLPSGQYFGDIIWVILCVDEGGLLGLTQQLSTLGREMNSYPGSNPASPSANPFGLSTPVGTSPQPIYSVPHNSPANGVLHVSPARRSLFNSMVNGDHLEPVISPSIQVGSPLNSKEEESLVNQLRDASLLQDSDLDHS